MSARLFLLPCLLASTLHAAFSIATPTAAQVVTANSLAVTVAEVPAATDRVEYYADGLLLEPCGIVAKQIAAGCQQSKPWGTTYYTLAQGESPVALYAIAKNVFGTALATTATVTFTTKAMGPALWFLNDFSSPVSGDVDLQVAMNHPFGPSAQNRPYCAVDGRINSGTAFNGDFLQFVGALSGPPYGYNYTLKTARLPNGTHEVYCVEWNTIPSVYSAGSAQTFAPANVNTSTGAITLAYHALINGASTTAGQPGRVTLTTTGACPTGLTCNGVQVYYVVQSVQSNTPASSDNIKLSLTVGGAAIVPSTQGTGVHTITYSIPNPFYCDFSPSDCIPAEVTSTAPFAYRRALITTSNGAAAMEMRLPQTDCFLVASGTCSAAPTVYNTDGTTTAVTATIPAYAVVVEGGVSGCVTVNASGLVTAASSPPANPCWASITVSCSSGACNTLETRTMRVMVQSSNIFPHFSRTGPVRTTYSVSDSLIPRGMFFQGSLQVVGTPWLGTVMQNSGINYTNDGMPNDVADPAVPTCVAATSAWDSAYGFMQTATSTYGFAHELDIYALSWPPWNVRAILNNDSYDRQACLTNIFTDIINDGNILALGGFDETNGVWGGFPLRNGTVGASTYFQSVSVNSNTATFTVLMDRLFNWNQAGPSGTDWVKLIGATSPTALNGVYKVSNVATDASARTISFTTTTSGVGNGTYNASNNPAMQIVNWHPGFGQDATCVLPASIGVSDVTTQVFDSTLTSMVASSGTLTVNWTAHGMSTGDIVRIWQATNTNLNQIAAITKINNNSFTIPTLAANGTYNSGTDASLYVTVDCGFTNGLFADLIGVYNLAGATRPALYWPILGTTYTDAFAYSVQNWNSATLSQADFNYSFGFSALVPSLYGYDQSVFEPQIDYYGTVIAQRAYEREPRQALLPAAQDYIKTTAGFSPDFRSDRPQGNAYALRGVSSTATIMWQLANGISGFRTYTYPPEVASLFAQALNTRISTGIRHYTVGEKWNAQSLAFNLIKRLEKYWLQPRMASPDYGPLIYTGAHTGSSGAALLVGNASELPQTLTVSLTACRQSSGSINRYRLTGRTLSVSTLVANPTSDSVTFEGGEVIAYTCQVAGPSDLEAIAFPTQALPTGATKMAVKVGYYPDSVDYSDATDCTAGCSLSVDRYNAPVWYKLLYLDNSNVVKYAGDAQKWASR